MPSVTVRVTDASGHLATKVASFGQIWASSLFSAAGFTNEPLDIILGITYQESWDNVTRLGGYADAVGDISLISTKWGCSVGLPQIRTLRNPYIWGPLDRWRDAAKLKDPAFQAAAAWALSKQGTDFTDWSVFNNETYLERLGMDYLVRVGHSKASHWND
jgi:hypothetical protein